MFRLMITVRDYAKRCPDAFQYLTDNGLQITFCPEFSTLSKQEKKRLLLDKDALHVTTDLWDADTLAMAPKLRIISRMGSGMDNIDLHYCAEHGIIVTNSRGFNANSVAELSMLLILASLRGLNSLYNIAQSGRWGDRFAGRELKGKTVGLLGFGLIARRLAVLLSPFQVHICSCDPLMDADAAKELNVTPVTFEELLQAADVLSIHIPATKENIGLFNSETFSQMKTGSVFINCSRGALVDEKALYHALSSGKLYAAAVDVFAEEPLSPANPLFSLPNFIGTPHVGGTTVECVYNDSMTVAKSLVACKRGETPGFQVSI